VTSKQPEIRFPLVRVDVSEDALRRQYTGIELDKQAKRLVKRFVRMSRPFEALIDALVQDSRTDYETFDDFARHALWELLQAYRVAGYPDSEGLGKELEHRRVLQRKARDLANRQEVQDQLEHFDRDLTTAQRSSDKETIVEHLRWLESWMEESPSHTSKQAYRHLVLQRLSIQQSIRWLMEKVYERMSEEERELAERWNTMLEDWLARN